MIAALLLTLLAQTATPQRDTRPKTAVATGTISGIVTSADQQPVPLRRVRVRLNGEGDSLPRTIVTGDDGAFVFDRVPAGGYTVVPFKEGYISSSYGRVGPGRGATPITLAAGQSVRVAISLPRGAVITGTITDVDGAPAQGISVTAMTRRYFEGQGDWRYSSAGIPAGTTDDRGIYRIYGLPAGQYVVVVQPVTRLIGNPGGGQEVRSVSDGAVVPRTLTMAQVFYPGVTAVSSAARISVRAGEQRGGVDVPLQYVPLASVSGTVTLPPGWNPPVLTLSRNDEVAGMEPIRTTRADAAGRFTFPAVPPGQYRAIARSTPASATPGAAFSEAPGERLFAFADVTVEGEDVSSVALTGQAGLTIAGQIIFEGQNPPAVIPGRTTVPLVAQGNFSFPLPPIAVDGIRFRTEGVFPGIYRFAGVMRGVRTPIGQWWLKSLVIGGRDVLDAPLDLRQSVDDAVATFSDRASDVSGTVVDAQGSPLVDAWVIAASTNRAAWFLNSRRIAAVHPDRDGRYTIRNLPPGDYRIFVTRDIEEGEWFDPTVLEHLIAAGTPLTIAGVEKTIINLKHP